MPTEALDDEPRRFVICGDNPLALRLANELRTRYASEVCVIVRSARHGWGAQLAARDGVEVVEAERPDAAAYRAAGVSEADGLALVDQDDGGNIDAAMLARELYPRLRIVLRMFNRSLGEGIAGLLGNCAVLSESAIAAPAFVSAALDGEARRVIDLAGQQLYVAPRDEVSPDDVACGLAVGADGDDDLEVLPADEQRADLVLAFSRTPRPVPTPVRHHPHPLRTLALLLGRRLRLALTMLLAVLLLASLVLAVVDRQLGWWLSFYTVVLTTLGGASPERSVPLAEQLLQLLLALLSAALIPLVTAAVVAAMVNARLRLAAGGLAEPIEDHVVVVGLGNVGTRVLRALYERGVPTVAVDRHEQARGVPVARQLRIPVIIGDSTHEQTLLAASVRTCRTLLVVSAPDVSTLETALLGRAANPDVRLVLRLFDGEFAGRVQRLLRDSSSHSVSYLAAPAFAAALLGQPILDVIPVRRRVLLVCEVGIPDGCDLDGQPVGTLYRPHQVRLLGIRTGRGRQTIWSPPRARQLQRSDRVLAVCTRTGLSWLLAATEPPAVVSPEVHQA
jgi:Trk K+ transport system NAD-binding subunit